MKLSTLRPSVLPARIRVWVFQKRFPDAPWLTEAAILFLDSWLRANDTGIEWGSGRSTIWLAERVDSLLSIEHDGAWSTMVANGLKAKSLECKVRRLQRPLDESYEGAAETVPDRSLDFALVDGRRRLHCMKVIVPKIKPGGILILDNSERYIANNALGLHSTAIGKRDRHLSAWNSIMEELTPWRTVLTTNRIWDTRIWIRPGD